MPLVACAVSCIQLGFHRVTDCDGVGDREEYIGGTIIVWDEYIRALLVKSCFLPKGLADSPVTFTVVPIADHRAAMYTTYANCYLMILASLLRMLPVVRGGSSHCRCGSLVAITNPALQCRGPKRRETNMPLEICASPRFATTTTMRHRETLDGTTLKYRQSDAIREAQDSGVTDRSVIPGMPQQDGLATYKPIRHQLL
ncbi:hypothetical protein F5B22DRAFT_629721 [Xylaria bambusicola]|uniref:uncharacterized protein n=1 Tax=Xylaria bambusicola TaxID=326684 RepID=UPI0020088918|nr:uncharacterized protein F5B22DRAFT_629721 [Xylaria bambusicola]KAI0503280.1 hypothetical protein F5B22DRAFT_629721 [Xylaria bambusicola]